MVKKTKCPNCGNEIEVKKGGVLKGFLFGAVIVSLFFIVESYIPTLTPEEETKYQELVVVAETALDNGNLVEAEKALSEAIAIQSTLKTDELTEKAKELSRQFQQAELVEQAKLIPASDYQANINVYQKLVNLAPENQTYLKKLNQYRELKRQADEAARAERERIAKLNSTGKWENRFYVDNFGEPSSTPYIRLFEEDGLFSNTATQNSDLNAVFLVDSQISVSLMLYEYDGRNPVKTYGEDEYFVSVQDKDGNRFQIQAVNYSDRLTFSRENSKILHNAFLKGGEIKIRIAEKYNSVNQYSINIDDADGYGNAYRKLEEAKSKSK